MLARRFTIVCLLITLFAMLLSIVVSQAGRPVRSWEIGTVVACPFDEGPSCVRSLRR